MTLRLRLLGAGALALVALALVALAGGCSSDEKSAEAVPSTWAQVASTLERRLDLSSANPCVRGDETCFELLLGEMAGRIRQLAAACDHDVLFARLYMRMTEEMRDAVKTGRFENPAAVTHFVAWFADYYFDAYDAWHAGRREAVPDVWRVAFDASDRHALRGVGNLLLGMNAHISRDLVFAVADLRDEPATEVDPDFALVTELIAEVSDDAMGELGDRFDPSLLHVQLPLVLSRESFGAAIAVWRTEAWWNAMPLVGADADERAAAYRRIEQQAMLRATLLLPTASYAPIIEGPEQRDAYCARKRRG